MASEPTAFSSGSQRWRPGSGWRSWLFGAAVVAMLAGAVLHYGEIRNFGTIIARARPIWLGAALLLQLSTYVSVASGWRFVLARADAPRPLLRLMRIAVTKLFADQALPTAGMGGNVLLVDQLCTLGVARGTAVAALLVSMIGFYAAYSCFALAMLLLLWLHNRATPLMAGIVTTFLLVAFAIPALALWLRRRGSRPLPKRIERIGFVRGLLDSARRAPAALLSDRHLLIEVTACNALIFLADAATLYACLHALGQTASFATAFIALIMASIIVTLGPIPLGLGSFEATSTATLHLLGISVEAAFTATMLLRLLTLWLPLLPGMVLMRSMIRARPRRAQKGRRAKPPVPPQPPQRHR
ncbi:lysylphosphatidylglycerol synthase transmembrane domain-containing protein [Flavisphingomonas formosensis]|uniref:lysylphosphatidylglycerol synthase transmembrane domain-containing protein n=1 Tax=Flavisphingomonas formosensis TaxID=861534 RepID=UPI0012F9612A|nr:lysylphosphatidylglycerol synthase transmembrane domain-containing protein [Sphingomonas formosensis]